MKEDIYIKMLQYGKANLENGGFRYHELLDHLKSNGHPDITENNAIVKAFFPEVFFSPSTSEIHPSAFFQIKPEAYIQLLDFESAQQSRKAARQANVIAIAAIIVTLLTTLLSIMF